MKMRAFEFNLNRMGTFGGNGYLKLRGNMYVYFIKVPLTFVIVFFIISLYV